MTRATWLHSLVLALLLTVPGALHAQAATPAPVPIRLLEFSYRTLVSGPLTGSALTEQVEAILAEQPGIEVVESGAAYLISGMIVEGVGTRVRISLSLVRVQDGSVVVRRSLTYDQGGGRDPLPQALAKAAVETLREGKVLPPGPEGGPG